MDSFGSIWVRVEEEGGGLYVIGRAGKRVGSRLSAAGQGFDMYIGPYGGPMEIKNIQREK